MTTVGNTEIVEQLNTALQYILESTPNFAEDAYYANYPDVKMTDIQLNNKELSYIREKQSVSVAVSKDWHPFYCKDNPQEQHQGMLPDVLDEISAFTGLDFTYVFGENYAECVRMVQDGQADIMGVYLDGMENAAAHELALSNPYLDLNNIVLKYKSVSTLKDGLVCGIMTGRTLPDSFEASKIVSYDTVAELLEAVNTGKVDFIYGVSAMLEQELQKHRYLNVAR